LITIIIDKINLYLFVKAILFIHFILFLLKNILSLIIYLIQLIYPQSNYHFINQHLYFLIFNQFINFILNCSYLIQIIIAIINFHCIFIMFLQ
jgi:hypothetical protein